MKRTNHSALSRLFFVMLAIDAGLVSILVGLVLNALVENIGLTPALIAWVAAYLSFMIVFSGVLFVLVVVTVTIRVKDAQRSKEMLRRRREMELKRRKQRL